MNERILPGSGVEQSGRTKIGVIKLEDLLEMPKLVFELCELLDTCDENERHQINRTLETGLPRL